MPPKFDGPIRLDERFLTTLDVTALTGVPRKHIENWSVPRGRAAQPVLRLGDRSGPRIRYDLLEAMQYAVMHDLISRVPLSPSIASNAAKLVARYVAEHSPADADGRPLADVNAIPRTLAFAMIMQDDDAQVGLIDPVRSGYMAYSGPYSRAHVVIPIAALVGHVLERLLHIVTSKVRA